jgi:hypothetical protein
VEHDALAGYDLVHWEIRQRIETGHDVDGAQQQLDALDREDQPALYALYDELAKLTRAPGWAYQ